MRKFSTLILVFISLSSFAFEGMVKVQYKQFNGTSDKYDFVWNFKDVKCALSMTLLNGEVAAKTTFIPDIANNQLLIFAQDPSVSEKIFYNIPVTNINGAASKTTMQHTGQIKDIAGVNCEQYIFKSENNTCEVWIAKSISIDWKQLASFFKTSTAIQAMAEHSIVGFPMEVLDKNEQGLIIESSQTTEVATNKQSDAVFVVPSDYKAQAVENK
jgi:hypothetical protein